MFKVSRQQDNKFTLECHLYNQKEHYNTFLYSMSNILLNDLADSLQGRIPEEAVEDVLAVVKLTNRPAFITDAGVVTAVVTPAL